MKKILLAGLLLAGTAQAEYLPAGCYVADYYRTDECWGEDVGYFQWYSHSMSSSGNENAYYGVAVSTLVQQETIYRLAYEQIASENASYKKLIKKLKRACGSKCRSIR